MTTRVWAWVPAVILGVGALFTEGVDTQRALPLRASLEATVPDSIEGYVGEDLTISDAELRVVGVTDYLYRQYLPTVDTEVRADTAAPAAAAPFTVYVGYYDQQERGKTIHSPKNCLPGAGWEALTSSTEQVTLADGEAVTVNRYLIQRDEERALVFYWYQGRGRIESNEYRVKIDLLLDTAFRSRSDEALVRLVVPVTTSVDDALRLARTASADIIPALTRALPS